MIAAIAVTGLGRLATRLELPDGDCEILGESEAGKSLLVESTCYALFGVGSDGDAADVGLVAGERADIEIQFTWGDSIRRPVTSKRIGGATLTMDGTEYRHATQVALSAALGADLGGRAYLCRHLIAPMVWSRLPAAGRGSLAELILSALPPADLRAEVARLMGEAGADLRPSDPTEEKAAIEARRLANSARDTAAGRLEEARRALAALAGALPDAPPASRIDWACATLAARDAWTAYGEIADARARRDVLIRRIESAPPVGVDLEEAAEASRILAARDAWAAHDHALESHHAAVARRADAVRRRDDIRSRRTALGERPTADTAALRARREAIARVAVGPFAAAAIAAAGTLATAEAALMALSGAGTDCPTCGQPWSARADARAAAVESRDAARTEADRTARALETTRASLASLQAEVAGLESAAATVTTWDQRARDIGPEPSVPPVPVAPTAPDAVRPSEEQAAWASSVRQACADATALTRRHTADVAAAHAELGDMPALLDAEPAVPRPDATDLADAEEIMRASAAADGASAERTRARTEAERAVATAERTAATTTAEADRLDVLVSACRRAPGAIAERQSAALGDMGPVSIRWTEAGGAEVLVDGRAWHRASTGRRILADLHFRAALARAAGLDWLTLFVDECQSWSGAWPDVGVRQVRLRTAAGVLRVGAA